MWCGRPAPDPALEKCALVELGPNPAGVIAPADLATEFDADPKKCSEKYNGLAVVVEGVVFSRNWEASGGFFKYKYLNLVWGEAKDCSVVCSSGVYESVVADRMKNGQRVKIVGKFVSSGK